VSDGTSGGVCVRVPVEDAGVAYKSNFSLAVITSNVYADYGAVEYYFNGANTISVSASVQPTLEFAIVSSTDIGYEQHTCHMGTLNLTNVGTCDYRLRVSTNAANGFQITIGTNQQLGSGYATLTDITEDSGVVTAGSESYGIAITGATIGGNNGSGNHNQAITENGDFTDNDTPVPLTSVGAQNIISYSNSFLGTSTQSTTLVEHRAAIDAATVVGSYQQTVTYQITPTF
jgi:hypothetical protein